MRISRLLALAVAVAFCTASRTNGAMSSAAMRESAFEAASIDRISIGGAYEAMERKIKTRSGGDTLKTRNAYFMFGYDALPWWRLFATGGATELEIPGTSTFSDWQFRWSLGMQANLWRVEVSHPDFLAGGLSFRSSLEYSLTSFRDAKHDLDGDWGEISLDLPFTYEIYSDRRDNIGQVPYSLALSVGPAFSFIDGSGSYESDHSYIRQNNAVGAVGAVDVYLADNVSVGAQFHYFDKVTVGGNIVLHF